ncbi:MAG: hypothetical protein J1E80_05465 [Desulfovibrionaceae bacterium]|nr:hypothetical protein [Desulfovibrionaceae bacterium]
MAHTNFHNLQKKFWGFITPLLKPFLKPFISKFDGRRGWFAGRYINMDRYDSSVDNGCYIFGSFRNRLAFEYEIPLTNHCNLNCQTCTAFSPIAEKSFLSMEIFCRDVTRMAELYGSENIWLRMVGGEPLLHPQITQMIHLSRKLLPHALISITTNGLLARNMNENFYTVAKNNNIVILNSPYPPINADDIITFLRNLGINAFKTVENFSTRKIPLDIEGTQNAKISFARCTYRCNFIVDGMISRCFYPGVIIHFNKYFKKDLKTTDKDSIDIHKHTAKDIKEFLELPMDFCRYCKNDIYEYSEWKQSSKQISEWT